MSWLGIAIGWPFAGERMLFEDSIRTLASICASGESGTCTAIWSPSKSALKAVQTSGWILIALPSTSIGSKAWMPEAVERGRAVQQHRVLADDLLEEVPHLGPLLLDHLLGGLDRGDQAFLLELVVDERLEQLERHLLRQAALVQLQLGADHDDRAAGVVDALAEQVLAEAALLALERVGERLERPVVGPAQHAAAAAVVEERVHRLLQHALLVAHDDVRRPQLDQLLQPVVAVDDAAVEVVQVGGGEAAAVEGHERTQLGRE